MPPELLRLAVFLAKEPAWPAAAARQVVDALAAGGHPILGVELWERVGDYPRVINYSGYEFDPEGGNYVRLCADGARSFIDQFEDAPGALFNLTL